MTEQATETAERLTAELAPLGEGAEPHGKMPYRSVPGWPEPTDLLGPATRALEAARAAKA